MLGGKKGLSNYYNQFWKQQISYQMNKGNIKTNQKFKNASSLFPQNKVLLLTLITRVVSDLNLI